MIEKQIIKKQASLISMVMMSELIADSLNIYGYFIRNKIFSSSVLNYIHPYILFDQCISILKAPNTININFYSIFRKEKTFIQ